MRAARRSSYANSAFDYRTLKLHRSRRFYLTNGGSGGWVLSYGIGPAKGKATSANDRGHSLSIRPAPVHDDPGTDLARRAAERGSARRSRAPR